MPYSCNESHLVRNWLIVADDPETCSIATLMVLAMSGTNQHVLKAFPLRNFPQKLVTNYVFLFPAFIICCGALQLQNPVHEMLFFLLPWGMAILAVVVFLRIRVSCCGVVIDEWTLMSLWASHQPMNLKRGSSLHQLTCPPWLHEKRKWTLYK